MRFTEDIDFGDGVIVHNAIDEAYVESLNSFFDNSLHLKKDLLQVSYVRESGLLLVDVGWYENDVLPRGLFTVSLIVNENREQPAYATVARSFVELKEQIRAAITKVDG